MLWKHSKKQQLQELLRVHYLIILQQDMKKTAQLVVLEPPALSMTHKIPIYHTVV